jgi:putative AlgH/UPF0301 family transcriptional regulator
MAGKLRALTAPQYFLLVDISDAPQAVSSAYAPAKKLVELGYAEWTRGKYSDHLAITDAGRQTLESDNG